MAQHVSNGATTATEAGSQALDGLHEPLLPINQRTSHARASWLGSLRGAWLSMCGYLYDDVSGSWTDGDPRPEGAFAGSTRVDSFYLLVYVCSIHLMARPLLTDWSSLAVEFRFCRPALMLPGAGRGHDFVDTMFIVSRLRGGVVAQAGAGQGQGQPVVLSSVCRAEVESTGTPHVTV